MHWCSKYQCAYCSFGNSSFLFHYMFSEMCVVGTTSSAQGLCSCDYSLKLLHRSFSLYFIIPISIWNAASFPWFHAPFQLLLKVQMLLLLPHLPFSPQSVVSVPTLPDETAVSKKVTSVLLMHYSRLSSPTPWKLHKYLLINKILF